MAAIASEVCGKDGTAPNARAEVAADKANGETGETGLDRFEGGATAATIVATTATPTEPSTGGERNPSAAGPRPRARRRVAIQSRSYVPVGAQDDPGHMLETERVVGESRVLPAPNVGRREVVTLPAAIPNAGAPVVGDRVIVDGDNPSDADL